MASVMGISQASFFDRSRAGGTIAGLAQPPTDALLTLYYRGMRSERVRAAGRGAGRAARRITVRDNGGGDRS